MVETLVAPFKLYQKSAPRGGSICGGLYALLTLLNLVLAAPLAAIAPPARKSNDGKIPMAQEPKILPSILVSRDSQGGK